MRADFEKADLILETAFNEGRNYLYEHEIYDLLSMVNVGITPVYSVVRSTAEIEGLIDSLECEKYVCKIINPLITHKSDVGGVVIALKEDVPDTIRRIFETAAQSHEESTGVLVSEFIEAPAGFGHELFIGMRDTVEFGPVINVGLGGVNTELFASEIKKGRSGVTISPGVSDEKELFDAFKETIAYETLSGLARGHEKLVDDNNLMQVLSYFHALVWRYSPLNPDAPFHITEFEINPFLCDNGELRPVDGLLRFGKPEILAQSPPVEKISRLLKPENICVIGVSARTMNLGRIILTHLLDGDIPTEKLAIVKSKQDQIDGVKCYQSIANLPEKYDLVVLAVAAESVPSIVSELINHDRAESIILISSGMGEKEGAENIEGELKTVLSGSRTREDKGPVLVGGNSLGVISRPGGYATTFQHPDRLPLNPENPLGSKIALVSQSGAFTITRMDKLGGMVPRYLISTGNQADLAVCDFVEHLMDDPEVKVFGCYLEGINRLGGLHLAETSRRILKRANGERTIVVYKAGRTDEGRSATGGHTSAIAGDWDVADDVLTRSGCIAAKSFDEFRNLLMLAATISDVPISGNRVAAVANAGYETVGIADNLVGNNYSLEISQLTDVTTAKLAEILQENGLDSLVNNRNPLDLTPMATDMVYVEVAKILAKDPGVDLIIQCCVPYTTNMKTLRIKGIANGGPDDPTSFTQLLIKAVGNEITKPLIIVIDAGKLYDPMAEMFLNAGIPVFRSADEAVRAVGKFVHSKLKYGAPRFIS